ncbi:MAG TPA: N-acetylglucosamine-6-phosphate deacetylase [Anaerolineaceae bacterium]|nr:N-acetylglucosamine-6-phosphate deacetylase [Anaerolineaceae bacterium]
MNQIINNVKIILKDQIIYDNQLLIHDGKIAAITQESLPVDDCLMIDGEGLYLSPGFIDIHNHGNSGFDAMDATTEALETISRFHMKNGVTGFLATTMTASYGETICAIENAVEYSTRVDTQSSQMLGLYLEGPYFSVKKKGAQTEKYITAIHLDELKSYVDCGKGFVKIVALAPELEKSKEAITLLVDKGITVSAGHSYATYEETIAGIENGISEATHMFNGMRNFDHREPGIVGACLLDDRVTCEMICDGIHLHPAAMQIIIKMKGNERVALISDSISANGIPDGVYDYLGLKVTVNNNEVRLPDGTLAGSTLSLNKAVSNLVKMTGVDLPTAVRMASLNPARQIGLSETKGSIEVGKDADIILFDEDINIKRTFIKGVPAYKEGSPKR